MASNQVKRALLSVHNKDGLLDFARGLDGLGVQLISSGGTAAVLRAAGLPVTEVSEITGFPEILDGRIKTLHPKIHGGILARRDSAADRKTLEQYGIHGIDLVCINLYPFEQTIARPDCTLEMAIEHIDVGGPTMIRAAAKNFRYVYAVTRPQQYVTVLRSLREREAWLDAGLAEELAREAFAQTARYDAAIYRYLAGRTPNEWPRRMFLEFRRGEPLRYGENPHQTGAVYWEASGRPMTGPTPAPSPAGAPGASGDSGKRPDNPSGSGVAPKLVRTAPSLARATLLSGKEISFNNLADADAAWQLVNDFDEPAAAVIKHANPCGAALGETPAEAFDRAYSGDPAAAFGGIIAFNRPVDETTADLMIRPGRFLEVIVAPAFSEKAVRIITGGPAWGRNARLLAVGEVAEGAAGHSLSPDISGLHPVASAVVPAADSGGALRNGGPLPLDYKRIGGGLLVQTADAEADDQTTWKIVTTRAPSDREYDDLAFAWKVVKHVRSNAVVLVKDCTLVGVGAGQMKRSDSSAIAVRLAGARSQGAVVASDAFFPFRDGLEEVARAGVSAVIQPGGSKRDEEVITAADQNNIAMVFTGRRHFKH